MRLLPGIAVIAIVLGGCASSPKPTTELADAKAAARAASELGAANEPQAALHLKLATDQIYAAEREMADHDNDDARRLLERARSDAELSLLLTRGAEQSARARAAIARVRALEGQQP